jgi:hypothetical protein
MLIDISKVQILSISRIGESSGIQITAFESAFYSRLDPILATILLPRGELEYYDDDHFEQMGNDYRLYAELVLWYLLA